MPAYFSREALYDLVWSGPMSKVAPDLGITATGLKKVCVKARIPVPEQGYWNRLAAGKRVEKVPLPPREIGMSLTVTIHKPGVHAPEEEGGEIPEPPTFPEPLEAIRERVATLIGSVPISDIKKKAHPSIARLLDADERRLKEQQETGRSWPEARFAHPLEQRRLTILNALFQALWRGRWVGTTDAAGRSISVEVGDCRQMLYLEAGRDPERQPNLYHLGKSPPFSVLLLDMWPPTDPRVRGPRKWLDDAAGPLESKLAEIATEIVVAAENRLREGLIEHRQWRLRQKAEAEAAAVALSLRQEKEARERQAELERAAIRRLVDEAEALRTAEAIRGYVNQVERVFRATDEDAARLEAWRRWALGHADRIDPIKNLSFLVSAPPAQAS